MKLKNNYPFNIQAIAFDIDGTLLDSNHLIKPSSLKAINLAKSQGIKIIFCSGRPYVDMKQIQAKYQIADYMVCNNGAYWYDVATKKFHYQTSIDKQIVQSIIETNQSTCGLLALHTDLGTYRARLCPETYMPKWIQLALKEDAQLFIDKYNLSITNILEALKKSQVINQVAFHLQKHQAKLLASQLINQYQKLISVTIASETYVDINPQNTNKFLGLKRLSNFLGIDFNKIVAFGDSGNDLEMLSKIGYGICMGNGTKEAKQAAKEVICTNDSNAIGLKIEELINFKSEEI